MSNFFDEHYDRYDAWYEENRLAYLSELEVFKKILPERGAGLEIGVGSGRFAAPLGITTGIDPSKKMLELARKRGVDARLGAGEELPFEDSTFDYVAIIVTLCFVRDPEKVISESSRILKPNGQLIVGIIDKESFLGKFYRKNGSIFYGHARFFDVGDITRMFKAAGFKRFSYYQTIFDLPDKLKAVDKPLRGFGKGGFVAVSAVSKKQDVGS
jgi:SAM-dependent methyltransferase